MNISWRLRRQLMYLAIPVIPALLIGGFLLFRHYTTASCYDGKLNQGEQGIDCEGPCPQICVARVLPPQITWANAFPTLPGTYNLAAGIENRNEDLAAEGASVIFRVYSAAEEELYASKVTLDLRPSSTVIAFDGGVRLSDTPARVEMTFDFDDDKWRRLDSNELGPVPIVLSKEIIGTQREPRVQGVIANQSDKRLYEVPVVALVLNGQGEAVAASSTTVDIQPHSQSTVTYTWPRPFPTSSAICQQPVDVILAIDASGSMNSVSIDPPEPLATVKAAAKRFIGLFSQRDQLGVVSFANDADLIQPLTSNLSARVEGVDSIIITPEAESGYTNIAAALLQSLNTLAAAPQTNRGQAIILLTDGQPTAPDGAPDPELAAISAAVQIRSAGINLFVIGLGAEVDQSFLDKLVNNDTTRVFQTTDPDQLSTIYSQIASAVCERSPYGVELYPNVGI